MEFGNLNSWIQKIIDKKDIFLVVVVLLVAFFCASILLGDYFSKISALKEQMNEKSKKAELISEYNNIKDKLDVFKSSLPRAVTADEIVNGIANDGAKEGIDITNVNTRDPQNFDTYTIFTMNVSIKAKNFKSLVAFFHKIEQSSHGLKIQSWSGRLDKDGEGALICEIVLTATQAKYDS